MAFLFCLSFGTSFFGLKGACLFWLGLVRSIYRSFPRQLHMVAQPWNPLTESLSLNGYHGNSRIHSEPRRIEQRISHCAFFLIFSLYGVQQEPTARTDKISTVASCALSSIFGTAHKVAGEAVAARLLRRCFFICCSATDFFHPLIESSVYSYTKASWQMNTSTPVYPIAFHH